MYDDCDHRHSQLLPLLLPSSSPSPSLSSVLSFLCLCSSVSVQYLDFIVGVLRPVSAFVLDLVAFGDGQHQPREFLFMHDGK